MKIKKTIMAVSLPFLIVATISVSGCATKNQSLYYWGSYQSQVSGYFKAEKSPEAQIIALEADREKARAENKPLPPGFEAHLAMLYGKTGRTDQFVEHIQAEKTQFPESSTFMDFLLKKFKK